MTNEERAQVLEEAAAICETKVKRPAGYGGRWEGYGSFMELMNGEECAAEIRRLYEKA